MGRAKKKISKTLFCNAKWIVNQIRVNEPVIAKNTLPADLFASAGEKGSRGLRGDPPPFDVQAIAGRTGAALVLNFLYGLATRG